MCLIPIRYEIAMLFRRRARVFNRCHVCREVWWKREKRVVQVKTAGEVSLCVKVRTLSIVLLY
jgi:hypothetical protein